MTPSPDRRTTRLRIVVGKGGVGRSTIAAALAVSAAAAGDRVLLVDATGSGGTALALGEHIDPAIELVELSTEAVLEEYIGLYLTVPIPAASLAPIARLFDYVATAAPAVREILTIGKVGNEVRRRHWDLVVVDGPATGHVVELLSAPNVLHDLVGLGPLASQTTWLAELLADPEITTAIAVTLPEELPVLEVTELVARIGDDTDVTVGGLVVNRMPPSIGAAGEEEAAALADAGDPLAKLAALAVDRARVAGRLGPRLEELGLATIEVADVLGDPLPAAVDALKGAPW